MRITEPAGSWRKSSYSDNDGNCVEVAIAAPEVGVRDTKDRAAGQLAVTGSAWEALLASVR
jgi:hypothetical protein